MSTCKQGFDVRTSQGWGKRCNNGGMDETEEESIEAQQMHIQWSKVSSTELLNTEFPVSCGLAAMQANMSALGCVLRPLHYNTLQEQEACTGHCISIIPLVMMKDSDPIHVSVCWSCSK